MAEKTMIITGKLAALNISLISGRPQITFDVNEKLDALKGYETLKDIDQLEINVKPHHKKRSLNANAYAWKLITEIADVLRASKESVYLQMLKRYGQSELISVLAHVPISNYIKYHEEASESMLNGKLFKHYRVFKGSSDFDSREMAVLIDGIIDEAKALDIPTETPDEIARIKSLWNER